MHKFGRNFIRKLTAGVLTATLITGCGAAAATDDVSESGASGAGQAAKVTEAAEATEDADAGDNGADEDGGEDGDGTESTGKPRLMEEDEEEATPSRALMKARQVHNAGDSVIYPVKDKKNKKKNYSILVYMIGSDLEASYGYATKDMNEMENSGINLTDNNLLVYAGGSRMWKSDIPSDQNNILDMSLEGEERVVANTKDTSDMGSPDTLAAFLEYAVDYYPADHYALFFWDHGGGSVYGYGNDTLYSGDSLLLSEMDEVMAESPFKEGGKAHLDLVGFDACLMSTAENAAVWSKYADYMIASEETEPGDGWCYHFLDAFNDTDSAEEIGRAIIDEYSEYYAARRSPLNNPDITLALLDLGQMMGLVEGINGMVLSMNEKISSHYFPDLVRTRSSTKMFGVRSSRSEAYDLLDIGDLAFRIKSKFPREASVVESALKEVIAYSTKEVEGSCGLSLYFPGENMELYEAVAESEDDDMYISSIFADFVDRYTDLWMTASDVDWTMPAPVNSGDEVTVQLTDEQMENLDKATYTVLTDEGNGYYRRVLCKVEVTPDEDNVLHIPTDPTLIFAQNSMETLEVPCTFVQVEDRGDAATYDSMRTFLSYGADIMSSPYDYVTATVEETDGEFSIKSFRYNNSVVAVGGKNTVDISEYATLNEYTSDTVYPTRDEDGVMLPYYKWDSQTGVLTAYLMQIDDTFHFTGRRVSEIETPTVVQVVLQDINGAEHGSEICELNAGAIPVVYESVTLNTPKGTLDFEIRGEEAYLKKYKGDDTSLELPREVEGYPLRGLDHNSIASAYSLRSLVIPEGVRQIGDSAISYDTSLKELTLPSTLELLSRNAIGSLDMLEKITVNGVSKAVTSVDGVLFSADGKTLLKYPTKKSRYYAVPEGTETIAYNAFAEADLIEIEFPETLKNIDNYAFEGCLGLDGLNFPDSLQRIGAGAFSEGITLFTDEEINRLIETVKIGANVSNIGLEAFTGYRIASFEVSEDNTAFSSVNGMIMSKAGDVLVYCPEEIGGSVILPEGVTGLTAGVFSALPANTGFYFPDSLTRMSLDDFPYTEDDNYEKVYNLTIYCSKGSASETFAARNKLNYQLVDPEELNLGSYVNESVPALNGYYKFRVYDDHAVFISYVGSDLSIAVPETVKGVPVTEIGDGKNAVYGDDDYSFDRDYGDDEIEVVSLGHYQSDDLINVDIPDSVIRINDGAFSDGHIKIDEFRLPDHLESIGPRAFGNSQSAPEIRSFAISEENPYFMVADGVLFSKDGSALLHFPTVPTTDMQVFDVEREGRNKHYVYQVPEGCSEIGPYAFANCMLVDAYSSFGTAETDFEIRFSSGLEQVGDFAFCDAQISDVEMNEGLELIGDSAFKSSRLVSDVLILPSTVEELGDQAFEGIYRKNEEDDLVYGFSRIELPDGLKSIGEEVFSAFSESHYTCDTLVIGKKLSKIDTKAFYDFRTLAYEVNEKNSSYSSEDGCLLSKDGEELIQVPQDLSGTLHVPEGVTKIGKYAFYRCENISDIYIGPDVTYINPQAIYVDENEPVIHGEAGSEAERFAGSIGFEWREEA